MMLLDLLGWDDTMKGIFGHWFSLDLANGAGSGRVRVIPNLANQL